MRWCAAPALTLVLLCGAVVDPPAASATCLATPPCLEATFPGAYTWPTLSPGPGGNVSAEQVVTVTSNELWGVRIASDLGDGRMKEWTGTAYVATAPKVLTNALEWSLTRIDAVAQSVNYRALSSTAAAVVSGRPSTCQGDPILCTSSEVGVTYRQRVSFGDPPAGANDYRIEVIYEAGQGF